MLSRFQWFSLLQWLMVSQCGSGLALHLMKERKLQNGSLIFLANLVD